MKVDKNLVIVSGLNPINEYSDNFFGPITDSNIKQLSNSEYIFANISIGVLLTRNFLYCILTSFIGSVPKTVTHKIHLFNLVL